MALSQLSQIRSDGIGFIDYRTLYFNKYVYRARVHMVGAYLCSYSSKKEDFEKRIKTNKSIKTANADDLVKFATFKKEMKKGLSTVRIEGNVASVFSNDLNYLKELQTLGFVVDYTEVQDNVPTGTKYFVEEPKFKYRIYLKSKRVPEEFSKRLQGMLDRYKGTATKILPSPSLKNWLTERGTPSLGGWLAWKRSYCSSHYFIDYNDESFITIFALTFDNMIYRKFKLEKRPESI